MEQRQCDIPHYIDHINTRGSIQTSSNAPVDVPRGRHPYALCYLTHALVARALLRRAGCQPQPPAGSLIYALQALEMAIGLGPNLLQCCSGWHPLDMGGQRWSSMVGCRASCAPPRTTLRSVPTNSARALSSTRSHGRRAHMQFGQACDCAVLPAYVHHHFMTTIGTTSKPSAVQSALQVITHQPVPRMPLTQSHVSTSSGLAPLWRPPLLPRKRSRCVSALKQARRNTRHAVPLHKQWRKAC